MKIAEAIESVFVVAICALLLATAAFIIYNEGQSCAIEKETK
jgi:hypothetical protein